MLLSFQIMAMPTWKEMPCVENLQIAYCVNCRNTNITGYCCQQSVFGDCYRDMRHFVYSAEKIKRFVVHLHCIVSNVASECANTQDHQNCCAVKSHCRTRTCNIAKQWKSKQTRSYLNEMLFCSYFDKIVYLLYNSQSLLFIENSTCSSLK